MHFVRPFKPRENALGKDVCAPSRRNIYPLLSTHRPGSQHTTPRRERPMVCTAPPADMGDSRALNYDYCSSPNATVKDEPVSFDVSHRLLRSPAPSSTRSSSTVRYPAPSLRPKRKSSYTSRGELSVMTHPYGSWSSSGLKNDQTSGQRGYSSAMHHTGSNRRGGSGDQSYPYSEYSQREQYPSEDARHSPANAMIATSSLSGAVGDLGVSSHSPSNASPSGMAWTPSPTSGFPGAYIVIPDDSNTTHYLATPDTPLHTESPQSAFVSYPSYNTYSTSEPSLQHPSGLPSPTGYQDHFAYSQNRAPVMHTRPAPLSESPLSIQMGISPPPSAGCIPNISRSSRPSQERMEEEIRYLKDRIRELESSNHLATERVKQLGFEVGRSGYRNLHASSSTSGGLPSPAASPATSTSFEEAWRARTEARKKHLCSVNRAGNALCAWHDSRRERRAYPPRMAPAGCLNCGCTYEEALFEESLSRHGVGSYHPGESVRMDPTLRNPLLKLLQRRYGYRDGDFERDPVTGEWYEDEGPAKWEAKAATGVASLKRGRGDERR